MSRSLYKMPYIHQTLALGLKKQSLSSDSARNRPNQQTLHKAMKVYARASTITPNFIGLTAQIHNGCRFVSLKITPDVIGFKFGAFAPTKRTAYYRKKKK